MQDSARQVKKVLVLILFANLLVAAAKLIIGGYIQSASMTADGFHSLTDGVSNIVGLIGIGYAAKPIDIDHPYGHKKFESLTGLFIGGILLLIAVQIVTEAIEKIRHPVMPDFGVETVAALIITLLINIVVCKY